MNIKNRKTSATVEVVIVMLMGIFSATPIHADVLLEKVQAALMERQYNPGLIDGMMGDRTRQAIESYQKDNDLIITGSVNQETLNALHIEHKLTARDGNISFSGRITAINIEAPLNISSTNLSASTGEPQLVFMLAEKPDLKFEMSMENAQAAGLVTIEPLSPGSHLKRASVNEIQGTVTVDAKKTKKNGIYTALKVREISDVSE